MMGQFRLISNYMKMDLFRHGLNSLSQKTFGLSFEEWYQNGYCQDQYIPYSFEKNGEIIANASANIMNFTLYGKPISWIQIGTVETAKPYQNQGLASALIHTIMEDYKEVDGIYLFANDKARPFYEKLGFRVGQEYQYYKDITVSGKRTFRPVEEAERPRYLEYVMRSAGQSPLAMHNFGLTAFWTASLEEVWYSSELDCYVAAEIKEDVIYIKDVIALKQIMPEEIAAHFGASNCRVVTGYTPMQRDGWQVQKYKEEDTTFMYMGNVDFVEKEMMMFPVFSHA